MTILCEWLRHVKLPDAFDDTYKQSFYKSLQVLKETAKLRIEFQPDDSYIELTNEEYLEFFEVLWEYNKLVNVSAFIQPTGIAYTIEDGKLQTTDLSCDSVLFTTKLNGIGLPKDLVEKPKPFLSTLYLCIFYIVKQSKKISYEDKEYSVYTICYGTNAQ